MDSIPTNPVFSIPFRYLWSADFSGHLEIHGEQTAEISRFVGDQANRNLQMFSDQRTMAPMELPMADPWPITLFGPSGTGKTSLALTIIGDITCQGSNDSGPHERPIVLSSLDFDRRFQSAIETDSVDDFRNRYVQCCGLVIDDIHKMASRNSAQKELLYLFDRLKQKNRPLIFTSDRDPSRFEDFLPQLRSRLSGGLCLPVNAPGTDARSIIVRDLCRINKIDISPDGQQLIVDRLQVTVPKIVSFFLSLQNSLKSKGAVDSSGTQVAVDATTLEELFAQSQLDVDRMVKSVIGSVSKSFGVKRSDMRGNSRRQAVVQARGVAIYLLRNVLGLTFQNIGTHFGNRDHSTVLHAYRKISDSMSESNQDDNLEMVRKTKQLERELASEMTGKISFG